MSKFQDAIKQMQKKREKTAETLAFFLEAEAKQKVKVKTGDLRRKITSETQHTSTSSKAKVGTNVEYAQALEEGSKPHAINYSKPQHLNIEGRWVTVKKINHPGTKAQPFLKPSIDDNLSEIKTMIQKGMS
jgi:phage gpG-like protein